MSMTTAWFLHSRGRLSEQDYSWVPAQPRQTGAPAPEELLARGCGGRSIGELVDDSKSSLLLYALPEFAYRQQVWILLLTGLAPENTAERDHMDRDIRVTVLGVGTGPVPPRALTDVAAHFLTGGLRTVPLFHGLEGATGYGVDAGAWDAVVARAAEFEAPRSDRVSGKHMVVVDTDSPANRERAAGMIAHATRCFAQGTLSASEARLVGSQARPFLVVTTLLGTESLKSLRPWYGLSRHVVRQEVVGVRRALGDSLKDRLMGMGSALAVCAVLTVLAVAGTMAALLR
ncbi:hypothetical protein I2W78_01380 [Streptomyces spinoverrucosus]|uniref:hypothetical protein n=1 Tax=Streptomyces spinoverrucosus TaxID=284043 RepID=UPI0018C3A823|nr:hypothetical protein [Streptomyces spinoverrucosus]MBG0850540.1 hypothetical protein [Streptomyces spinoverrucosus]